MVFLFAFAALIITILLALYLWLPRPSLTFPSSSSLPIATPSFMPFSPFQRLADPLIPPYRNPDAPLWPYAYSDKVGYTGPFQPLGYLSNENDQVLPLFGRILNGSRYQYYTVTDNDIKIKVNTKQQREIEANQQVELDGQSKPFKVFLYDTGDKWL